MTVQSQNNKAEAQSSGLNTTDCMDRTVLPVPELSIRRSPCLMCTMHKPRHGSR